MTCAGQCGLYPQQKVSNDDEFNFESDLGGYSGSLCRLSGRTPSSLLIKGQTLHGVVAVPSRIFAKGPLIQCEALGT